MLAPQGVALVEHAEFGAAVLRTVEHLQAARPPLGKDQRQVVAGQRRAIELQWAVEMMGLAKVFQQCRPVDQAGQPQVAPVALQHMKVLADLQEIAAVSSAGQAASSVIEDLLEASRNGLPTVAGKAEHLQLRGLVAGSEVDEVVAQAQGERFRPFVARYQHLVPAVERHLIHALHQILNGAGEDRLAAGQSGGMQRGIHPDVDQQQHTAGPARCEQRLLVHGR